MEIGDVVEYKGLIGEIYFKENDLIIIEILENGKDIKCTINDVTLIKNYKVCLELYDKIEANPGIIYENLMGLPFSEDEINEGIEQLCNERKITILERYVSGNKYSDLYFYPGTGYFIVVKNFLNGVLNEKIDRQ